MTEVILPADAIPTSARFEPLNTSTIFASDTTNAIRSSEIAGGDALQLTLQLPSLKDTVENAIRRQRILSPLKRLRNQAGRVWVPPPGYRQQGSAVHEELFRDPHFTSGSTTGLTSGSQFTISLRDRVLRMSRSANTGVAGMVRLTNAATVTGRACYGGRALVMPARGPSGGINLRFGSSAAAGDYKTGADQAAGLVQLGIVAPASSMHYVVVQSQVNAMAGDILELAYFSLCRCWLVDMGENHLLYSDDLSNAAWTKSNATAPATSVTLPNGAAGTTNTLHEDGTAASAHTAQQAATVPADIPDVCFIAAVKAGTRSWVQLRVHDGSTFISAYFDVTNGLVGTTSFGANWSNGNAQILSLGNGWYACAVMGKRTTGATSLTSRIAVGSADNTNTFNGLDADSLFVWRATLARSLIPVRQVQTTSAALASGAYQSGLEFHVRGLPASTNNLLRIGDWVQIDRELHKLAAPLDSDAMGRGALVLSNPSRQTHAVDQPVFYTNPVGKFLLADNSFGWDDFPGRRSAPVEVKFIEATAG